MNKEDPTRNIQPDSQEDQPSVIPASQEEEESQDPHGLSHPQARLVRRLELRQRAMEVSHLARSSRPFLLLSISYVRIL